MVANDASALKRLSYVARRFLQELQSRTVINMLKVSGTANPADALTKYIEDKSKWHLYMQRLYNNRGISELADTSSSRLGGVS